MLTAVGVTTLKLTTADVLEMPPAVATAFSAYEPAGNPFAIRLKGGLCTEPSGVVLLRKVTFVTVPPAILAIAPNLTSAGAANTAPAAGFVIVTVGGTAVGAVERV